MAIHITFILNLIQMTVEIKMRFKVLQSRQMYREAPENEHGWLKGLFHAIFWLLYLRAVTKLNRSEWLS